MSEDPRLYSIARQVTDEILGAGTYDKLNHPYKSGMADIGDRMPPIRQSVPGMEEFFLYADHQNKAGMQCGRCHESWLMDNLQEAVVFWNEHHCTV